MNVILLLLVNVLFLANGFTACNENFPTIEYNGNCQATINGAEPTSTSLQACENDASGYELPDGWSVAIGSDDVRAVSAAYPWSTRYYVSTRSSNWE